MTVAVDVSLVDGVVVTDVVDLSVEPLSPHAARPNTASTTAPTHTVSRPGDNRFGLVGMVQYLSSGSVVVADTRCPGSSNTAIGHRGHHAKPGVPPSVSFGVVLWAVAATYPGRTKSGPKSPSAARSVRSSSYIRYRKRSATRNFMHRHH